MTNPTTPAAKPVNPTIQVFLDRFKLASIGAAHIDPMNVSDVTSRVWYEVWTQLVNLESAICDLNALLERVSHHAVAERKELADGALQSDWVAVYAAKIPAAHAAVTTAVNQLVLLHSFIKAGE